MPDEGHSPSRAARGAPALPPPGCCVTSPSSRDGRRRYLAQVVALALLPVVALITQNCSSMLRVSREYDTARAAQAEIKTAGVVDDAVSVLQQEREAITLYILKKKNRVDLEESFDRTDALLVALRTAGVEVIGDVTSQEEDGKTEDSLTELVVTLDQYATLNEKLLERATSGMTSAASGNLWREVSASRDLAAAGEHASAAGALGAMRLLRGARALGAPGLALLVHHLALHADRLAAVPPTPRLQAATRCQCCTRNRDLVYQNKPQPGNATAASEYVEAITNYVNQIKHYQQYLCSVIESMLEDQMWEARQSQLVGVALLVLVVIVSPVIIILVRHATDTIQTFAASLEARTLELRSEKQKSDHLLCQMLPAAVIRQLRLSRAVPAESFSCVTVYFSDIVGFTELAASSSAMEVVIMLNSLYRLFDSRILKHDVYKVETIGDAYMVASGLPQRNGDRHAGEIADMALELMAGIAGYRIPHRQLEPLRVRAGVHTGPCVAGVVGTAMPRYCLFGDTINTASRMESSGEEMRIHISSTTKEALDKIDEGYITEARGKLIIKGKGEMDTYFLTGKTGKLANIEDIPDLLQEPEFLNIL